MTMHAHPHSDNTKQTKRTTHRNSENEGSKKIVLFEIALEMNKANLPKMFIVNAIRAALDFEGISDLMKLWRDEKEPEEKNEIVADIQDMLDACLQKEKIEESYIKFNDLETISKHIRAFKDSLLSTVIKNGGITHLSELTEIPQPSLSRFFNSNAMPQRSTLLKISKALGLDEIKMESLPNKASNLNRDK